MTNPQIHILRVCLVSTRCGFQAAYPYPRPNLTNYSNLITIRLLFSDGHNRRAAFPTRLPKNKSCYSFPSGCAACSAALCASAGLTTRRCMPTGRRNTPTAPNAWPPSRPNCAVRASGRTCCRFREKRQPTVKSHSPIRAATSSGWKACSLRQAKYAASTTTPF